MDNIQAVELVDKLMMHFRNNVRPSDADLVLAYEAGINVKALERYIKEVELDGETDEEYEQDDWT